MMVCSKCFESRVYGGEGCACVRAAKAEARRKRTRAATEALQKHIESLEQIEFGCWSRRGLSRNLPVPTMHEYKGKELLRIQRAFASAFESSLFGSKK